MSTQKTINAIKKVCKNGNVKLYDVADIAKNAIIRHRMQYATYVTLFGDGIQYSEQYNFSRYPVTSEAIQKKCDISIVCGVLMKLESKGNETARDILYDRYRDFECGISFDELLQECRLSIMECEIDELITIGYREIYDGENGYVESYDKPYIKTINDDNTSIVIRRLYGAVSSYLYKFRVKDKKHLSYELGDNELVDIMDRKTLSEYVDVDEFIQSRFIKAFKNYVAMNSKNKSTRVNIIDGLINGLTYRQISEKYNVGLSTINDNVVALKRLYKEFTTVSTNISWLYSNELEFMPEYEINTIVNGEYKFETTKNRDLLEYCNYIF